MFSHGRVKRNKFFVYSSIIIALGSWPLLSLELRAQDFEADVFVPGHSAATHDYVPKKSGETHALENLEQTEHKYAPLSKPGDPVSPVFLSDDKPPVVSDKAKIDQYSLPQDSKEFTASFEIVKPKKLLSGLRQMGTSRLSLSYIKDDFDYQDRAQIFQRSFRNSDGLAKARNYGQLYVGGDYFFNKNSWFRPFWGIGLGIGFNQGKGRFVGRSGVSDGSTISLWTLPLEISAGGDITLGRWLGLNIGGGVGALGLYQSRSDLGQGEDGKRRRQVGFGYHGSGSLKISMSELWPQQSLRLYESDNLTQYYLHLGIKLVNYSQFKNKDIKITGTSFFLGFNFEYL
jgi:hypothetical protein